MVGNFATCAQTGKRKRSKEVPHFQHLSLTSKLEIHAQSDQGLSSLARVLCGSLVTGTAERQRDGSVQYRDAMGRLTGSAMAGPPSGAAP